METLITSELQLSEAARLLISSFKERRVFAFHGEMGAGKTTFIKAACKELGVVSPMSSPTFSLVNEYLSSDGKTIFHFDFYRLDSEEEAMQAGLHDYFFTGNYCFVEWPERAPGLLPSDTVHVTITVKGNSRLIVAQ